MQTEYISAKTIIGEFWIGGTYDIVAIAGTPEVQTRAGHREWAGGSGYRENRNTFERVFEAGSL
jgi:hypothetical protein